MKYNVEKFYIPISEFIKIKLDDDIVQELPYVIHLLIISWAFASWFWENSSIIL